MKRIVVLFAGAVLAATAASATAAPGGILLIRHQVRGCHSWSYNGNTFRPAQTVHLARGAAITVVNNDVMPHRLVQKSGPAAKFVGTPLLNHMAASLRVVFPKAGVYTFTTEPGEDYPMMMKMKTIGEDYVLTLRVIVS